MYTKIYEFTFVYCNVWNVWNLISSVFGTYWIKWCLIVYLREYFGLSLSAIIIMNSFQPHKWDHHYFICSFGFSLEIISQLDADEEYIIDYTIMAWVKEWFVLALAYHERELWIATRIFMLCSTHNFNFRIGKSNYLLYEVEINRLWRVHAMVHALPLGRMLFMYALYFIYTEYICLY